MNKSMTSNATKTKILIRDLPNGTLEKLKKMADENFRSLEGEARYALKTYAEKSRNVIAGYHSKDEDLEDKQPDDSSEVQSLRLSEKHLHAVIHSMNRKLALGSNAISLDDLNERNDELATVERQLVLLGKYPTQQTDI